MEQYYGVVIPANAVDEAIDESARFYSEENGDLNIRSKMRNAEQFEEARQILRGIDSRHLHVTFLFD